MAGLPDLHIPHDGDATSAFDDPDAFGVFWDELTSGTLPQPCLESGSLSNEPFPLQEQEQDGMAEDSEGQRRHRDQVLSQEWDGVTEPPGDTLRYDVEWRAVLRLVAFSGLHQLLICIY